MLPVKTSLLPTVSRFFDDDWNNLFDWSNRSMTPYQSTIPPVNIHEISDHFILEVAAAGFSKDDFNIELDNSTLTISTNVQRDDDSDDSKYHRREFNFQSFKRSFTLNEKIIDFSKIEASYTNGILKIAIAKKDEAKEKPVRSINIS